MSDLRPIRRALISVSDKSGVVEFARKLAAMDIEILSTAVITPESNMSPDVNVFIVASSPAPAAVTV